jgi:NADH-quinone oxidoreductase subunit J
MELFFYLFSSLLILSSLLVISSKNQIHAVLWLIFGFCNASGLFLILNAEYLAMMLIVVYVGAVAILFLFVVMLTASKNNYTQNNKFQTFIVFLFGMSLFANISFILFTKFGTKEAVYQGSFVDLDYKEIARLLYTKYFIAFQVSGIALLVAMIGCISLTFRKTESKKQNSISQIARNREDSIQLEKIKSGEGYDV